MTDEQDDGPAHVCIEFVGGPYCGAVVDSRTQPIRALILRQLLALAKSDRPAELLVRSGCPRLARVKVQRTRRAASHTGEERLHRYHLLVELGFSCRVLFRADYAGAVAA